MDNDSIAAFQNPSAILSNPIDTVVEEANETPVVSNAHVPSLDDVAPASAIGPYGKLMRPAGPSPEELRAAEEKVEREHIVNRLTRLNAKENFPTIRFSPETDSLSTLRRLNRLATHTGRLKMSVNFMKRATIFLCRLIEGFCNRFPIAKKYGLNLEGFSEHLMLTINSFDELLSDIYDAYSDTIVEASPVLMYVGAIGSQMLIYSATRTIMARTQDAARKKAEEEKRARDEEIAQILRARQRAQSSKMSGPGDVPASELEDNRSVGFESVKTDPASPARSVRFAEEPEQVAPVEKKNEVGKSDTDDTASRIQMDV